MRDSFSLTVSDEALRDFKLSESNFYDDDGEAWSCYDILE
jgi:hypothetical protein